MQPEEWNERERIERDANLLWAKMVEVEKYNLLRAVDELSELFEVIDKDLNGAGDVWAASFTIAISRGKNPIESAKFANACSAISIKYKGLDFTFNESEIYQLVNSL